MTVALEAFDESSLGNCEVSVSCIAMATICKYVYIQVLSSVAAMVMTHPRLRAEFWSTVSIVVMSGNCYFLMDRVPPEALGICCYLINQSQLRL